MMPGTSGIFTFLRRFLAGAALFAVTIIVILWVVLESGAFSDKRREIISEKLSDEIGRNVQVTGDARMRLGLTTKVWVENVVVPSPDVSKADILQVDKVRFDLDTSELFQRRIDWDNLVLLGAHFAFVKDLDDGTNWKREAVPNSPSGTGLQKSKVQN